jgi:hypothetical protein
MYICIFILVSILRHVSKIPIVILRPPTSCVRYTDARLFFTQIHTYYSRYVWVNFGFEALLTGKCLDEYLIISRSAARFATTLYMFFDVYNLTFRLLSCFRIYIPSSSFTSSPHSVY